MHVYTYIYAWLFIKISQQPLNVPNKCDPRLGCGNQFWIEKLATTRWQVNEPNKGKPNQCVYQWVYLYYLPLINIDNQ